MVLAPHATGQDIRDPPPDPPTLPPTTRRRKLGTQVCTLLRTSYTVHTTESALEMSPK